MDFAALAAPFPPAAVSWRVGSVTKDGTKGMALAYIDARDVMRRLDEVCGPAGWQDRYEIHGTRTLCSISIRVGDDWIAKTDGAGDSDIEAEKGSLSDAFKRAAVKWGIGRYLYDVDSPWVAIENKRIKPEEQSKLLRVLSGKGAPAAALPPQNSPQQQPAEPPKREAPAGTFDWQVPKKPCQIEPSWMGTPPNRTIDWAEWGGKLKHVLNLCTDEREVAEWVKLNRGPLKGLEGEKPTWYANLMASVTKRETDLRAGVRNTEAAAA